jgi:uncharacterized protein involved in outer membrane biogenesis
MLRMAIVLVLLLLVVFAGGALFLASSAGKALVLRTLSASLLSQLGVEARAAGLDYRPSSFGVTLHAVSIRQPAAARAFLNAERVEVDFSPAILSGTLQLRRFDLTKPEVVLDPTTQGASAFVPAAAREGQAHAPSSVTVPSFDIQGGRVRDLDGSLDPIRESHVRLLVSRRNRFVAGETIATVGLRQPRPCGAAGIANRREPEGPRRS